MSDKIYGRNPTGAGSGMATTREQLAELQDRRDKHERLTRGAPSKTFGEVFEAKMKKHRRVEEEEKERKKNEGEGEEEQPEEKKGAIDPLLGLSPGQSASIANPSKDRRSAKFIVKG